MAARLTKPLDPVVIHGGQGRHITAPTVRSARPRLLALAALPLLASCTVAKLVQWQPYVDTTQLQPGVSRPTVEGTLGPPVHEWDLRSGVHCASYEFVAGRLGNAADASAIAFMDVASLGIWEVVDAATGQVIAKNDVPSRRFVERVVVTYGTDGTALGFFDVYALLPENGVSGPRRWTHP